MAYTRKSKKRGRSPRLQVDMIAQIAVGVVGGLLGYAYLAIRPPPPRRCGSPGGPLITSPRVKLSDGRHLAYKERGVAKEEAKYKIIVSHGFDDSKDFYLPLSKDFVNEYHIYILSYDRAGYGESDPNPSRSVKSEAFDVEELADKLQLGPKFYVIGLSMGGYTVYSCLKYIPHRLSGAVLVGPMFHSWWRCFPPELSGKAFSRLLSQDQWSFRIAHYTPWLFHWWMTQKLFPSLSVLEGKLNYISQWDFDTIKQASGAIQASQEKARQQGNHECLHRDIIVGFGKWEFEPTDLINDFPNDKSFVHLWQGHEDKFVWYKMNQYLANLLPWVQYHAVPEAGHMLIHDATICEDIFKSLLSL